MLINVLGRFYSESDNSFEVLQWVNAQNMGEQFMPLYNVFNSYERRFIIFQKEI